MLQKFILLIWIYYFTIIYIDTIYNYGNLTIFTVYILLTVVIMVQNWQLIYNFTNLQILIKLSDDNIYNYNYNFTISQYNYNYNFTISQM